MKLTKRFLCALLAAAMLAIALPATIASAAADSATLTLDETTFERSSERLGTFVDGRLEIRKNESVGGRSAVVKLKNTLELTGPDMVARFYVRSPDAISGLFEFLKLGVKVGTKTTEKALTANLFSDNQNKSMLFEIPFTVASGDKVDITMNYLGSYNIIIDHIEVVPAGAAESAKSVDKSGETTGSVDAYTFTAADMENVSMIDSFTVSRGNVDVILPASYFNAWFEAGYTKAVVSFNNPEYAVQKRLATKMNSYNASNYLVDLYEMTVTLTDAKGSAVVLDAMPGSYTVKTVVPQRITSKFKAGARKLAIVYQGLENAAQDTSAIGTLEKVDGKVIATATVSGVGTTVIAASCLK